MRVFPATLSYIPCYIHTLTLGPTVTIAAAAAASSAEAHNSSTANWER